MGFAAAMAILAIASPREMLKYRASKRGSRSSCRRQPVLPSISPEGSRKDDWYVLRKSAWRELSRVAAPGAHVP
jgi:hypothetical protein